MTAIVVAVVGTGTEIGKTHVACALIGALVDGGARVIGWKPVESGVPDLVAPGSDEAALRLACGLEAPTLRLGDAVSPHL
ncbi:MAG: dethiobiotin synthase, partial [Proteobacteria bacterium]|nr:dethiobiotin synthase [Pseudomonadota bacterium]